MHSLPLISSAMKRFFFSLFICTACLALAEAVNADIPSKKPKIGLALSGGGARGIALIGVLKELERQRIPIDYISGTSMGSIVGALYASGRSVEEIEQIVQEIDWEDVFLTMEAEIKQEYVQRMRN